ncbi:TonB-dependent receptor [Tannerella sp.]|uniref:TonB-dependent receptor n=1 Tax=Tannerella sp. TaxID=2382127 RepID=UPI0026DBE910|nr:TonB-dependent receptor [Tannerella sp.]MDO4704007.1 TonB-dependent receptor [Tannerella sp.]
MNRKLTLLFSLLIVSWTMMPAMAQTAQITGTVIDANNREPLAGASVYIEQVKRGDATGHNGEFTITDLKAGDYTATVSYIGYYTLTEKITLREGESRAWTIRLAPETHSLSEVVVTAKTEARKLREQAMPISVINMKQIQGTVNNVTDILNKTMGVTIRSSGGVGSASRISVRGLEGKRIGFFIEGQPMNENSDFMDINDIPVEMIDRIEIYKGVIPAKFGGSAVGGAVNIVPTEYPPKYFDISYTIESFHTHKASAVLKRNLTKPGIELGLGGFYTYSDNDYTMESPYQRGLIIKRDHDRFEKLTVAAGFIFRKWYFDKLKFSPLFVRTHKQIQGIQYNIQHARSFSDSYAIENEIEKDHFLIDGLAFDCHMIYAYTRYHFLDTAKQRYHWDMTTYPAYSIYGGEIGIPSTAQNQKHTVMQQMNLNYVIDKLHALNFNSQFNYAKNIPNDTLKDKAIGYRTIFDSRMTSWVAGLSYEYKSTDEKLLNALTGKYYYYSMQTKLADFYGQNKINEVDIRKHNWGVNDAVRYKFTPDWLVKFSAGYEMRLPTENELIGDGFLLAPSGDLRPERSTNINIGTLYDRTASNKLFSIEVNAFYSYLKDMIRYTKGPLQGRYENFGEMRSLGVEAEIKADITSRLYGYVNATYQDLRDTRDHEPGSSVPNPSKRLRMPNIPYLLANAGLEYHRENLFGLKQTNTRMFVDGSFIEAYYYDFKQSIHQDKIIPRSFKCDIGLEQSFLNGGLSFSLRVNNVTDTRLLSEFNYPLPGRNVSARIRYVFK